jgi:uncharacterized membrane protein
MLPMIATYIPTLLILLVIDAVWLGLMALPMFKAVLGDLLLFRPLPGIVFYLMYAAGILVFVTPAGREGGFAAIVRQGLLFGLVAYGTYELTNYATLKPWTLKLVVSDMAWGAVVTAAAAALGWRAGLAILRALA